jgi:hypothetical protein
MRRALLVVVFSSFLCSSLWAEDPVYFPDPNLKIAVEMELSVSDPTPDDMLGLTSLRALWRGITDLTGLDYAHNLQTLVLRENKIHDISPLAGLLNLETLNLSMNQISDISAVAGLTNLRTLDVHDNRAISNISALSELSYLETLVLRHERISDISVLARLSNLQDVDLFENLISDIAPLSGLMLLDRLDIRGNPLNEEACETYIPLILANNPGVTLRYDQCGPCRVVISSTAGGSVIGPGEGEFLYSAGETIWLEAQADPCFAFVNWSGTDSSTRNPLYVLVAGDYQARANFVTVLKVLHVDDNAPGDPTRSDRQENGTVEHPFDQIQEAIEVAADGACVLVHPGTYRENLNLLGKNIRLLGIDPNDPNCTAYPVLEGLQGAPAVSFVSGEGAGCTLTGFVITRGKSPTASAILCDGASPTITNCLIVGNRASASTGAALQCTRSSAAFVNCTIADNYGGPQGAGLVLTDSTIQMTNCILWGNSPTEILLLGDSAASLCYCDVRGGWPDIGNLNSDPLFAGPGSWRNPSDPNELLDPKDERAIWTDGDYHLKAQAGRRDPALSQWVQDEVSSPCLDRGDPATPVGYEPAPNGGIINLGAYGGTTQASKSYEGAISGQ